MWQGGGGVISCPCYLWTCVAPVGYYAGGLAAARSFRPSGYRAGVAAHAPLSVQWVSSRYDRSISQTNRTRESLYAFRPCKALRLNIGFRYKSDVRLLTMANLTPEMANSRPGVTPLDLASIKSSTSTIFFLPCCKVRYCKAAKHQIYYCKGC